MMDALPSYDRDDRVVVVGSGAGVERLMAAAGAFGCRAARLPIGPDIAETLRSTAPALAVAIVVGEDDVDRLADLLDAADALRIDGAGGVILEFPPTLIDAVAAVARAGDLLLCDPSEGERIGALAMALTDRGLALTDGVSESEIERLQRLTEEVGRIARALIETSAPPPRGAGLILQTSTGEEGGAMIAPDGVSAATIRSMIRLRRLRDQYFDSTLLADPAWDMLLDLMAARAEGRQVAVSSLCIAAAVPSTTALRWIGTMTAAGLFVRRSDPVDRRRVFIALSDKAAAAMAGYFEAVDRVRGGAAA